MADNYLEKRMEEYQNGKQKPFRLVTKKIRAAFVCNGLSEIGQEKIAELLMQRDWHVAFSHNSFKEGQLFAQRSGTRFYHVQTQQELETAIADAKVHFSPLPLTIY